MRIREHNVSGNNDERLSYDMAEAKQKLRSRLNSQQKMKREASTEGQNNDNLPTIDPQARPLTNSIKTRNSNRAAKLPRASSSTMASLEVPSWLSI